MFKNKTAWFSGSVKRDILTFWVSQGGFISDWKAAEFLFSDDASCPDTERIHMSADYVMDRAIVFHSTFVSTCRLRRSAKSVPLGHYILPPASVQREVKARIGRFIWEQDELLAVTASHGNRSTESDVTGRKSEEGKKRKKNDAITESSSVCCGTQLYPVNNMLSGYVHIDELQKFSGELHDFLPSRSGYSVSRCDSRRLSCRFKEGQR